MFNEYRFFVDGRIPVLKLHGEPRPRPAVIVLHGLGADADTQRAELSALAGWELSAVGLDAPHHGARRDAWLDEMAALGPSESHERFLRLLLEAVPDVSQVIDHLLHEGHWPIGLAGISLGAYTALAVAARDSRVRATVSILGAPDWTPRDGHITPAIQELMQQAPVHRPWELARHPLLLMNAGRDQLVPPHWARDFAWRIREQHPTLGQHVDYVEYPESDHLMRPQDWGDLWWRALNFLRWHLS